MWRRGRPAICMISKKTGKPVYDGFSKKLRDKLSAFSVYDR
jgi:hypothetical protein